MNEIVMAMHALPHGWLRGFEDGVALTVTVVVIAITGALGRSGARFRSAELQRGNPPALSELRRGMGRIRR